MRSQDQRSVVKARYMELSGRQIHRADNLPLNDRVDDLCSLQSARALHVVEGDDWGAGCQE